VKRIAASAAREIGGTLKSAHRCSGSQLTPSSGPSTWDGPFLGCGFGRREVGLQQNPPIGALPLEQVIRDLRDSGIHVLIKTSDFGIMLFITDQLSVVRAERVIEGPKHSTRLGQMSMQLHGCIAKRWP
jgi:hypothetical protein